MRLVVGPLVVGLAGATEGCPRVRSDHFLLPTTANGYGNQYLALEKAAWLALATNRTLVLPPMLDHAGARAWGHWPPCGKSYAGEALRTYERIVAAGAPRWSTVLNFSKLASAGVRVVDYPLASSAEAVADGTGLCGSRAAGGLGAFDDEKVLVAGSPLRMDLDALRRNLQRSRCGWRVIDAVYAAPFVRRVAAAAARAARTPFAAVQLRTGDRPGAGADARTAHLVSFLKPRLEKLGLPVYVAYDLDASFDAFAAFLRASCDGCGAVFGRRQLPKYAGLVDAYGRELADVVLDLAFAARAASLFLSDDAPHAFRQRGTFGRLMKRYHMRQRDANFSTHYK